MLNHKLEASTGRGTIQWREGMFHNCEEFIKKLLKRNSTQIWRLRGFQYLHFSFTHIEKSTKVIYLQEKKMLSPVNFDVLISIIMFTEKMKNSLIFG